jgi:hypothetical protein
MTHRSMGYPHVPMTSYYLGVATPGPQGSVRPPRRGDEQRPD